MEHDDDTMKSKYYTVLTLSLAIFGTIATMGCLQFNEEHCVAKGGDQACLALASDEKKCMMSLGTEAETNMDGCMGMIIPNGFVEVPFGLPKRVGRHDDDMGYETVWSLIHECDVNDEEVDRVMDAYKPLHDEVLYELDGRSRVRVGSVQFDKGVIEEFNAAISNARAACGTNTTDGSSSTTSMSDVSESSTTSTTSTLEGSTTEVWCTSNTECIGAAGQLCNVQNGQCGSCDEMPEPDAACAAADPMTPLCLGDVCVACTEAEHGTCDQQLLICNPVAGTCGPCTEHNQCMSEACDIFVGICFDPATVIHVGGGGSTIAEGLLELENLWSHGLDSRRGVLMLHEGVYFDEDASIMDGSVPNTDAEAIAFIAAPGESPTWVHTAWINESPTLTVTGMTTRGYLDGVTLRGNTGDFIGWGLRCDGARVDIRRSRIVANGSGGILALGACELHVENSFIGVDADNEDAVSIRAADVTATILYSTLGAGFGNAAAALSCVDMADVEVRNSLLVARTGTPEVMCPSVKLMSNAWEAEDLGDMMNNWFHDYPDGNFHLTPLAPHTIQRADWQPGDPLTDIDGYPRITADGQLDHVGADVP